MKLYQAADIIVRASSVLPSRQCVTDDIARATAYGKRIFYIGTKHFGFNLNWVIRVSEAERGNLHNVLLEETIDHEREMAALIPPEHYVSIVDRIAPDRRVPITDNAGHILSPDRSHLTRAGAIYVGARVLEGTPLLQALSDTVSY